MEKVIIVGSGCAGLTAAIYAARANLNPLVLEGREPGGQLSTTTLVENFPGFPEGIDGPQLILNMHKQAENFGTRFSYAEVTDFEPRNNHIRVKADDEWIETRALIIASGASARWLQLENEEKLVGHGLTSCATCRRTKNASCRSHASSLPSGTIQIRKLIRENLRPIPTVT